MTLRVIAVKASAQKEDHRMVEICERAGMRGICGIIWERYCLATISATGRANWKASQNRVKSGVVVRVEVVTGSEGRAQWRMRNGWRARRESDKPRESLLLTILKVGGIAEVGFQ